MRYLHTILNEGSYFPNFKTTTKAELRLKDGTAIEPGTEVLCDFNSEDERSFYIRWNRRVITVDLAVGYRFLDGFEKQPRNAQLQAQMNQHDGRCTTPLGTLVNANGYGSFGEPSWMRVMGKVDPSL